MMKKRFKKIIQVAIVVDNLDRYLKIFNDEYGIGPWEIYYINKETTKDMKRDGKKREFEYKVAMCHLGDVELELTQPIDDNSIYSEFLKEHGPGLHHIGFEVDDFDKTLEFLNKKGIVTKQSGNWRGKMFAHMGTEKDLLFVLEIFKTEKDYKHPKPEDTYPKEGEK
ncbi:MAG: glyoxalase [Caldiserica bacterium]|nr:MAG: glyoxalase [Caldisericota bacterium]